jgi:oxaloacetate decarboxylase alpha subunit
VKRDYPLLSSPELDEARRLMKVANSPVVQIRSEAMNLTLRRKGA